MTLRGKVLELSRRLPTQAEMANATGVATTLAASRTENGSVLLRTSNGTLVRLEPAIAELVVELLAQVADGNRVTLIPTGALLSVQQAADILGISRMQATRLLDDGDIPWVSVGRQRRVMQADVLAFKERRDAARLSGAPTRPARAADAS
ncbi:helix-turn-helix domain-containing protein [Rubellimicrobium arenae]|uniref:helix-turn-helix domain-containing protein n=1 Tax=Rubellimicrobium arenae TaxID=2817372 RepID=UPI001FF00B13|nr:helix-turn-helix domain-containing protein [Rubellimicrobium arenae]